MLTPYYKYFWQDQTWAEFWLKGNGDNHAVYTIKIEFKTINIEAWVYVYPWFFGRKFLYIPHGPIVTNIYKVIPGITQNPYNQSKFEEHATFQNDIKIALQMFFQKIKVLANDLQANHIKIDLDDALCDLYKITSRNQARDFVANLLSMTLSGYEDENNILIQNIPKHSSINASQLHKNSLFNTSSIVLSKKRIMYWANYQIDITSIVSSEHATNTSRLLTSEVLASMFQKNKEFWKLRSSQVFNKTKKSLKQGFTIDDEQSDSNFEEFWIIFENTQQTKGFVAQSRSYFYEFFLSPHSFVRLVRNEEGNAVSALLGWIYCDTVIYMYGGSTDEGLKTFAPHFMHLHCISYSALRGFVWYDFGGYDPNTGYGFFKSGYKGISREFHGGIDLVCNRFEYNTINQTIQLAKKFKYIKMQFAPKKKSTS